MGSTHAVYILGEINGAAVRRAFAAWRRGYSLVLLKDTAALFQGAVLEPGVVAVYIHVDDFGALSDDTGFSNEAIDIIAAELVKTGFQVKVLHCHEVKRYIGLCLGGGGTYAVAPHAGQAGPHRQGHGGAHAGRNRVNVERFWANGGVQP